MNKIFAIVKKELFRFLTDKKLMLTTVLLPGLMIYGIYTFMGDGMANMFQTDEDYQPKVAVYDLPDTLSIRFQTLYMEQVDVSGVSVEEAKECVASQSLDLVIVFDEDFASKIEEGQKPEVEIYYNSVNTESSKIYQYVTSTLNSYEQSLSDVFTMNSREDSYDLASEKDVSAMIYSMMLPMLLLTFVYSGCVAVAPESIAGEKERGTIATLLVTPMKRSDLALGKVISLSIVALMSGISSFLGTLLSLPKLMGSTELEGMSAAVYSVTDYFLLFLIVISAVLLLTAVISIISAWTSSVKEASTAVSPLMIIVMLVGVSSMMLSGERMSTVLYLVPLYNLVLCMNGIFSFSYDLMQIAVALGMNLAVTAVLIVILTRMFNSEKVMFSK